MNATLTVDSFFAEALNFGPEGRLELAERLVASVSSDEAIESAQFDEVHRRMEDVQAGRMPLIAGKDALQQVREAILGRARRASESPRGEQSGGRMLYGLPSPSETGCNGGS